MHVHGSLAHVPRGCLSLAASQVSALEAQLETNTVAAKQQLREVEERHETALQQQRLQLQADAEAQAARHEAALRDSQAQALEQQRAAVAQAVATAVQETKAAETESAAAATATLRSTMQAEADSRVRAAQAKAEQQLAEATKQHTAEVCCVPWMRKHHRLWCSRSPPLVLWTPAGIHPATCPG